MHLWILLWTVTSLIFVLQANFPTQLLTEPKEVPAINGNVLVKIAHLSFPVSLTFSGNHHKMLPLFVISLPLSPVLLGSPWLKQQNLNFDCSS